MGFIDEKYKDCDPKVTVERINAILQRLGINIIEKWHDSGLENCYSLSICASGGMPTANGKGISKEFARASAYGEFIERLQAGLFFYKLQSITQNKDMDIHTFAPDVKYISMSELISDGEWMDYLIDAYGEGISRDSIAEQCFIYANTTEDKIPTVPYYSLFENKYVYLPSGFVEQMYTANGCCAGNSKEEAWVHALSEIMERHCAIRVLKSGTSVPKISDRTLSRFPAVSNILSLIREKEHYDVDVLDYSLDTGFPVVATRIIDKKRHSYRISEAADPVLEIAVQRTLTELFQGYSIGTVTSTHNGRILNEVSDVSITNNVINQLETASGFFTADFFANVAKQSKALPEFVNNRDKNNKELLEYILDKYRSMGKQVYVRNLSYLGFHSYKFVVPGFSETRAVWLQEMIPEYALAADAAKTMRNAAAASDDDLSFFLQHSGIIAGQLGRYNFFNRLSGVPITQNNAVLPSITRAYAAYRLHRYSEAMKFMEPWIRSDVLDADDKEYFACVNKYIELRLSKIEECKIRSILYKFFQKRYPDRLYRNIDSHCTPYDEFLISCDYKSCEHCKHSHICSFQQLKDMNARVGKVYSTFVHGQDRSEFAI